MTMRALVLGGGGPVGIAWESGLLAGLQASGVDVAGSDTVIGTSAGAVVGVQLALGAPPEALLARHLAPPSAEEARPITFDTRAFGLAVQQLAAATDPALRMKALGRISRETPTVDEASYLERFAAFRGAPWPARRLIVTAIETEEGTFMAWERHDEVPLQLAVAASCSVPGIFPSVAIAGRHYMDGGMRSGTNADLAEGHKTVLILQPISGALAVGFSGMHAEAEASRLRATGATVHLVQPDAEAIQSFGTNLMDVSRSAEVAQAGARQGRAIAESLRALW